LTVYRLTRRRYADLDGEGARRSGGRCNYIGTSAVYTSQFVSLAVLEVLVHLDKVEIPEDFEVSSGAPGSFGRCAARGRLHSLPNVSRRRG